MRVLFYIEPLTERDRPLFRQGWLGFVRHFQRGLEDGDHEIACVVSDALAPAAREKLPGANILVMDHSELMPALGCDPEVITNHWYLADAQDPLAVAYGVALRDKAGAFHPDVCISLSPAPFLTAAFPEAPVLYFEYGMFSRTPFPETGYLDPFGMLKNCGLSRFGAAIRAYQATPREAHLLASVRETYAPALFGRNTPLATLLRPQLSKFKNSLLVALQYSAHYSYGPHARFKAQFDTLAHVLENTPTNIAVVACEHPEFPLFDRETLSYLQTRHPHLVWSPEFRSVYASAQQLIGLVDGVATVSSSVGTQALLWQKKLIILGNSHLDDFADAHDLNGVADLLDQPHKNADGAVAWLLSKYYTPFSLLFSPAALQQKLEAALGGAPAREGFDWFRSHAPEGLRLTAYLSSPYAGFESPLTQPTKDADIVNLALYCSDGSEFEERLCIRRTVRLGAGASTVTFDLPESISATRFALRLADKKSEYFMLSAKAVSRASEVVHNWDLATDVTCPSGEALITPSLETGRILVEVLSSNALAPLSLADRQSPAACIVLTLEAADPLSISALHGARKVQECALSDIDRRLSVSIADTKSLGLDLQRLQTSVIDLAQTLADERKRTQALAASVIGEADLTRGEVKAHAESLARTIAEALIKPPLVKRPSLLKRLRQKLRRRKQKRREGSPAAAASTPATHAPIAQAARAAAISPPTAPDSGDDFVPRTRAEARPSAGVRPIAFYLPQFHPIPENNAWWGDGFTEWTNVTRGKPRFEGHYQPHAPEALGFYDLRVPEVQEQQAELAKQYGVYGFCFYFYWFGGKRLLEHPIRQFANNPRIDLPFCLCWANENWSRRWDGLDHELLISQNHSVQDDLNFISHVSDYLRNPRYIRVEGKPLVMVYRPSLLPEPKETAARWRTWCRENGVGEIYLAYTQSFDVVDPADYGFDAAIEFPPNLSGPPDLTAEMKSLEGAFEGKAYDYRVFPERSEHYAETNYPLYHSVFPSWDNEPRRNGGGTVFVHSAPDLFQRWTRNAALDTLKRQSAPDKRLMFINAWNEWAEGAHLEPDRRYGYAWLQSLRDGVSEAAQDFTGDEGDVVLVVHDAFRHGAQYLALNLAAAIRQEFKIGLQIVLLGPGPLKAEFARFGRVHDLTEIDPLGEQARALARRFKAQGVRGAICNATVSGLFLNTLAHAGIRCVALVHELPEIIQQRNLEAHAEAIATNAAWTVFPSDFVRAKFPAKPRTSTIRTQGLYKRNSNRSEAAKAAARARLRTEINAPQDASVILSVGFGDIRKGADLFVEIGALVMAADPKAYFVWVGEIEAPLIPRIEAAVRASGFADRFKLVGFKQDTDYYYAGSDVFALTSREDPFPTVIMESLDVNVPVIGFDGVGGFSDLFRTGVGILIPPFETQRFATEIRKLLDDSEQRCAMGSLGAAMVEEKYSFRRYVFDLMAMVDPTLLRVSVVVPNYNYARLMKARLDSILSQSYPIYEVIVLDDCSTDDSLDVIKSYLANKSVDRLLIARETNSGSPFRQWLAGVSAASGDVVWIAEADDLSEPAFLDATVPALRNANIVLSYCQSQQMAPDGSTLAPDYLHYVSDISQKKWRASYTANGIEEIRSALSVKNSIPNVSACVFRRQALLHALSESLDTILAFRVAGDWAAYVEVLRNGDIAFTPKAHNRHRRHEQSVTLSGFNENLLREILSMQSRVRTEFGAQEWLPCAKAYAQELYAQFNLASPDAPTVLKHPEFTQFFEQKAQAAE
jgi:glycosyltransferase involved in cell wall biosynthesis